MTDAEAVEALQKLASEVKATDPAFAEALEKEAAPFAGAESLDRVEKLVGEWAAHFGEREPYWTYYRFSTESSYALEDGILGLAVDTEAAFVAYAEGIVSLERTPAEHQTTLESIRDAKRAEAFRSLVATVEAEGTKAGIRVRHAGFTRALERCVPNPGFTVDYMQSHHENPGELAVTGALLGTAAVPIIGTAIGGVAGWVGGHLLHGKTPEANVERQKAWIVQAGQNVRITIEAASGDASELASAQMPYTGTPATPDENWRMLTLYNAARKFLPEGGG